VDQAGNLPATEASQLVTIDTTKPTTTARIDSISEDTGASATDFVTSDNNGLEIHATLTAALQAGETLQYSRNGAGTWSDAAASSVNGTAVIFTDASLTQSTTIKLRVVDQAGNLGDETQQAIVIDNTSSPTTVTITGISEDTGTAGDFLTSDSNGLDVMATLS